MEEEHASGLERRIDRIDGRIDKLEEKIDKADTRQAKNEATQGFMLGVGTAVGALLATFGNAIINAFKHIGP